MNAEGETMSRAGFEYVLDKHVCTARKTCASLNGRSRMVKILKAFESVEPAMMVSLHEGQ